MLFFQGLRHANGLETATGAQRAAVWLLSPLHAIHDAFQTAFWAPDITNYRAAIEAHDLVREREHSARNNAITGHLGDRTNIQAMINAVWAKMQNPSDGRNLNLGDPNSSSRGDSSNTVIAKCLVGHRDDFAQWLSNWGTGEAPNRVPLYTNAERVAILVVFGQQQALVQELLPPEVAAFSEERPHPSWLRYGIGATAITSIPQGAATYAAVFGLGLLCNTYIGGLVGTITHGITAGIAGVLLGSGRGVSGIASGLAIGVGAFALQTYGMQLLADLLPSLSDVHLHLVAGAVTILGTFLIEALAQVITRKFEDAQVSDPQYSSRIEYRSEYYLFAKVGELMDGIGGRCRGKCGNREERDELRDERD